VRVPPALPTSGSEVSGERRDSAILVAESRSSVGQELVEQLRADCYEAMLARTVEHARVLAGAHEIRAIVLGALDRSRGALDLLEEIRRSDGRSAEEPVWVEHLPVIVLSPGAGRLDLLRAFELGADDFIADPVCYLELRVRLKAILRRAEGLPTSRTLRIGSLEIDTAAHIARVAGLSVELCRLEYELLLHLARKPGEVCSKQELLQAIWGRRGTAGARTVDSHASRLRRKLDAAGAGGLVVNVWGVGYRLI
jgi:DNA-binding response OmpR family regulator